MTAKNPCSCSAKIKTYLEIKGRKSKATETNYHKSIHNFIQTMHMTPDELLRLPKQKIVDTLEKYITLQQNDGKAPKTINLNFHAVKGFLEHNGKKPEHKFVFDGSSRKSSYLKDIVPDADTLDRLLSYASPAGKVVVSLMGYAGLRPALLGQLKLRDFPEIDIQTLQPTKEPMIVTIPKGYIGNKAKSDYWSFLPKRGIDYLVTYLKSEHTEPLTSDTKIFNTTTIMYHAKTAFKAVGLKTRPYVLRSYFRAAVGHLNNQHFAKFLMGHTDIETLYEFQRALSQKQIDDYRQQYAGIVRYLIPSLAIDPRQVAKMRIAAVHPDWSDEQIEAEMQKIEAETQRVKGERHDWAKWRVGTTPIKAEEKHDPQKIISEAELGAHLAQGWFYVSALPSGKIVVGRYE